MNPTHRIELLPIIVALAGLAAQSALAQTDYPNKPIRMIVPFAAGGSTDVIARLLSEKLSDALGKPAIIENRPGAGSTVGVDVVVKSAPDGYTLAITANSAIAPGPLMRTTMPFDPLNDLAHIALIGTFTNGVVVPAASPYKTMRELIDAARANPGKLSYASAGIGSSGWLSGELLKRRANIDMVHVPYKGSGPAAIDLVAGRLDLMFESLVNATPNVRAGKARLIAVGSAKRSRFHPDVPTVAEIVPGVVGAPWFGFAAPAKTPAPILQRLERDITGVLRNNEVRNRLEEVGMEPSGAGSKELLEHIHAENALWGPIIKALNVKVE
ncbi:MAG: Bug family tripartite tricarboxylate transporter substrate binding protein [Burkholderiales bacterium]